MSFLLFAHRKLCLKRMISHKELRGTQLDNKLTSLHEQQGIMAEAKGATQSSISIFFKSSNNYLESMVNSKIFDANNKINRLGADYQKILADNGNDENAPAVLKAKEAWRFASENANINMRALQADYMREKNALAASEQAMNSIFANSDQGQAASLNAQEKQLTLEKTNNDTSLKLLHEELKSVEAGEDNAVKSTVSTFGLGGR